MLEKISSLYFSSSKKNYSMIWLVILLNFFKLAQCFKGVIPLDLSNQVSCFPVFYDETSSASINIYSDEVSSNEMLVMRATDAKKTVHEVKSYEHQFVFQHFVMRHLGQVVGLKDEGTAEVIFNGSISMMQPSIHLNIQKSSVYCATTLGRKPQVSSAPRIKVINSTGFPSYHRYIQALCDLWLNLVSIVLVILLLHRVKGNHSQGKVVTHAFVKYLLIPHILLEVFQILLLQLCNSFSPSDKPYFYLHVVDSIATILSVCHEAILPFGIILWCMGYGSIYGISEDGSEILPPLPQNLKSRATKLLLFEVSSTLASVLLNLDLQIYQYPDYVGDRLQFLSASGTHKFFFVTAILIKLSLHVLFPYFSVLHYLRIRVLLRQSITSSTNTLASQRAPAVASNYTFLLLSTPMILIAIGQIDFLADLNLFSFEYPLLEKPTALNMMLAHSIKDWPKYVVAVWIFFLGGRPSYARKAL